MLVVPDIVFFQDNEPPVDSGAWTGYFCSLYWGCYQGTYWVYIHLIDLELFYRTIVSRLRWLWTWTCTQTVCKTFLLLIILSFRLLLLPPKLHQRMPSLTRSRIPDRLVISGFTVTFVLQTLLTLSAQPELWCVYFAVSQPCYYSLCTEYWTAL